MKKLVKVALAGIGLSAAVWALRDRLVRIPPPTDVAHPPFRTGGVSPAATDEPEAEVDPDDLTQINGVGPVYARRLVESGIASFSEFFRTSTDTLSDITGASDEKVDHWLTQADDLP